MSEQQNPDVVITEAETAYNKLYASLGRRNRPVHRDRGNAIEIVNWEVHAQATINCFKDAIAKDAVACCHFSCERKGAYRAANILYSRGYVKAANDEASLSRKTFRRNCEREMKAWLSSVEVMRSMIQAVMDLMLPDFRKAIERFDARAISTLEDIQTRRSKCGTTVSGPEYLVIATAPYLRRFPSFDMSVKKLEEIDWKAWHLADASEDLLRTEVPSTPTSANDHPGKSPVSRMRRLARIQRRSSGPSEVVVEGESFSADLASSCRQLASDTRTRLRSNLFCGSEQTSRSIGSPAAALLSEVFRGPSWKNVIYPSMRGATEDMLAFCGATSMADREDAFKALWPNVQGMVQVSPSSFAPADSGASTCNSMVTSKSTATHERRLIARYGNLSHIEALAAFRTSSDSDREATILSELQQQCRSLMDTESDHSQSIDAGNSRSELPVDDTSQEVARGRSEKESEMDGRSVRGYASDDDASSGDGSSTELWSPV